MKKITFSLFAALLFVVSSVQAQASYRADTLDFASFLSECQRFSRNGQEELWVVTFWASWNSSSLYQLPALKSTYANYRNRPVRFFFLSRDRDRQIWQETLGREQLPGTHVLLSQTEDYEYLRQGFQHSSLPATFLVDANGNIYRVDRVQQLDDMLAEETRKLPNPYASTQTGPATSTGSSWSGGSGNAGNGSGPATTPSAGNGGYLTHTVRQSETLYGISRQYGVTVDQIRQLNALSDNLIKIGQELRIKRL